MSGRLFRGIAANGYGQLVTVGAQVLSVPLLLRTWGSERYGVWVLLTAVPAALAFADGGLVVAGGNAMTVAVARGDRERANLLFHAVLWSVLKTLALAAAALLVALLAIPTKGLAHAFPGVPGAGRDILGVLTLVVLAGTVASIPSAVLRADGRYAFSVTASTTMRLVETMAVLMVAMAGSGLLGGALAWLVARVAGTVWLSAIAVRKVAWLRPVGRRDALPDLRELRAPALASLAMPAALAIGLQGVTVAVGLAMSPAAVAVFAATRTLARAGVQLSGLVNHALMPEMARIAGHGDHAAMQAVARANTLCCAVLLGVGWGAIVLFGPWFMVAWSGGRLQPDLPLLDLTATAAALHGLWLGRANLLLALNRQAECAWDFLAVSLVVAGLAWPLAAAFGLPAVAALILAGEAVMVLRLWLPARRPDAPHLVVDGAPT